MARFDDLRAEPKLRALRPVPQSTLDRLLASHPDAPSDYLEFLRLIGAGTIGPEPGSFKLYGGLLEPEEIYGPERSGQLAGVLLFGDDFQGYCAGFDVNAGWRVVEVSPVNGSFEAFADSFENYLRTSILPD